MRARSLYLMSPGVALVSPSPDAYVPRTMYQNIKEWQPKAADFAERVRNSTVWDRRAAYVDLKYT